MAIRIELLAARHRREGFDCGGAALNGFLTQQAGQQQRRGVGKTYVALDADRVVGFVTLSAGQVATEQLPAHLKLPRYPIPVLRIGRLAVDRRDQGQGVGQDLLAFALTLALEFSAKVGLYAVVVDAKDERAATFYRRLGFQSVQDNDLCLFLPLSKLAKVGPGGTATEAGLKAQGAVNILLSPNEMGELFKVIALGKGMPPLLGFLRGDRAHAL